MTAKADRIVSDYLAGKVDVETARDAIVPLNREAVKLYVGFLDQKEEWEIGELEAQKWMEDLRERVILIVHAAWED